MESMRLTSPSSVGRTVTGAGDLTARVMTRAFPRRSADCSLSEHSAPGRTKNGAPFVTSTRSPANS